VNQDARGYEPAWPTLTALGLLSLWISLLSLPMLSGQWLAGPWSDQYSAGYAFRTWGAAEWHRAGHVPLWNPTLLGGLPFLGAMHGDVFYPTSFLRLIWPMPPVMNFGFFLHYILAGLFTYLLLRRLRLSWGASVAGACAYQLTGLIGSYPSPGHDGKLFASTMLPLMFLGLIIGMRERRLEGFAIVAAATGCALLGHPQVGYYTMFAAGLFALYLTFDDPAGRKPLAMLPSLAGALAAVILGIGTTMIQMMPLLAYAPYSLRAKGSDLGFDWATTYGIPWSHVPEFVFSRFVGSRETYWSVNGLKLHSEYLGLPVVALALLGAGAVKGRLKWWLAGIGGLFLVVSLASSTPLYQLWWRFVPYAGQVRAPGMAFFVVTLIVAIFAGFGVDRLERGELKVAPVAWLAAGAFVAIIAAGGVLGSVALGWAGALQAQLGRPLVDAAGAAQAGIRSGGVTSGLALLLLGALAWGHRRGRLKPVALALGVTLIIGTDLYLNARPFWVYSRADREMFRVDSVTSRLMALPKPFRVIESGVYPTDLLMAFGISDLFGRHGNELRAFDKLWGGRNGRYANQGSGALWGLFGLNYLVLPTEGGPDSIPGFRILERGASTSTGAAATVFERVQPEPYARVVPAAVKLGDEQAIKALVGSRPFYDQLVLLDSASSLTPAPVTQLPAPLGISVHFDEYQPGLMRLSLSPAPAVPAYAVVAENYFPDWRASVDGQPVKVERGDVTLITVPVPAGARTVELRFVSRAFERGKVISIASLLLVLLGLVAPPLARRPKSV
jgi:hypothetical protein